MVWVNLVTLCALLEYFVFAWLVGKARVQYGVKAPATSGHEVFERYFRVQQNTLELLIVFVPGLWIAAQYWDPRVMAAPSCRCAAAGCSDRARRRSSHT